MTRKYKLDVFDSEAGYNVKLSEYGKHSLPPIVYSFHNRINNKRPEVTAIKVHGGDYVLREEVRRFWGDVYYMDPRPDFAGYAAGKHGGRKIPHSFAVMIMNGDGLAVRPWFHGRDLGVQGLELKAAGKRGYRGCEVFGEEAGDA